MFTELRPFLDALRARGELREVTARVSPHLELPEIHRRVIAAGGPALLFRHVEGADLPLVTNLFGTLDRVELAFGGRPKEFIESLVGLVEDGEPPGPAALWARRGALSPALGIGLRRVARGPVTEVVTARPRLDRLPFTTSWPEGKPMSISTRRLSISSAPAPMTP